MAEKIYDVKLVRTVEEVIIVPDVLAPTGSIYEAMEMAEKLVRGSDAVAGESSVVTQPWDAVCAYPAKSQKVAMEQ